MMQVLFLCLVVLLVPVANALTVQLNGVVTNQSDQPIPDAVVSLASQGLVDTTDSQGTFSLSNSALGVGPSLHPEKGAITLDHGVLRLALQKASPVTVEIFDLGGRLLKRETKPRVQAGEFHWDLALTNWKNTPLFLKVSAGNQVFSFQTTLEEQALAGGESSQEKLASSPRPLALQSTLAAVDSLEVRADGYQNKTAYFSSYEQTVNITLDTVAPWVGSTGCGKSAALQSQTYTIQSGGQSRRYILDIPSDYDENHPYRLVIGYHWMGGNMTDVATGQTVTKDLWAYYGLKQLSNSSTIFIAPQGIENGWANSNGRDLIFTDDILKQVKEGLCIDTTRIFALGFSYGGGMSYAIACDRADVFRAVAVQSGANLSGCEDGTQPIPYFGTSSLTETMGRGLGQKMAEINGCTSQNLPLPGANSQSHICVHYEGCQEGYPVEWCTHTSGHTPAPYDGGGGDSGSKTWVPGEIWKFFTQF